MTPDASVSELLDGSEFEIHCDACGLARGELGPEGDLLCCGGMTDDVEEIWIQ